MSIAFTHVTAANVNSNVDAASYTTAQFTPTANTVLWVAVENSHGSAATLPTLSSSPALTWTQQAAGNGTTKRLTVFTASAGTSPAATTITADFAGVTQTGCTISVEESTGLDPSDPSVQVKTANATNAQSITTVFDAALDASSGVYAAAVRNDNDAVDPDTGFTELFDLGHNTPSSRLAVMWRADNDSSVVFADTGTDEPSNWTAVLVEVRAQGSVTVIAPAATSNVSALTPGIQAGSGAAITIVGGYGDLFENGVIDTPFWTEREQNGAIAFEGTGFFQVTVSTLATAEASVATANYDLRGSTTVIRVQSAGTPNVNTFCYLAYELDATNYVAIRVRNQNVQAFQSIGGTASQLAGVATTPAWMRLRESGGTTYWDYSADGVTWTNLYSTTNPISYTSAKARIGGANLGVLPGTNTFMLDDFRLTWARGEVLCSAPAPEVFISGGVTLSVPAAAVASSAPVPVPFFDTLEIPVAAVASSAKIPTVLIVEDGANVTLVVTPARNNVSAPAAVPGITLVGGNSGGGGADLFATSGQTFAGPGTVTYNVVDIDSSGGIGLQLIQNVHGSINELRIDQHADGLDGLRVGPTNTGGNDFTISQGYSKLYTHTGSEHQDACQCLGGVRITIRNMVFVAAAQGSSQGVLIQGGQGGNPTDVVFEDCIIGPGFTNSAVVGDNTTRSGFRRCRISQGGIFDLRVKSTAVNPVNEGNVIVDGDTDAIVQAAIASLVTPNQPALRAVNNVRAPAPSVSIVAAGGAVTLAVPPAVNTCIVDPPSIGVSELPVTIQVLAAQVACSARVPVPALSLTVPASAVASSAPGGGVSTDASITIIVPAAMSSAQAPVPEGHNVSLLGEPVLVVMGSNDLFLDPMAHTE